MKRVYLALAAIGYLAPGVPMVLESARSGNLLFWADPQRTISQLFANLTSTAFALDLAAAVLVALVWMTHEARPCRDRQSRLRTEVAGRCNHARLASRGDQA